MKNRFIFSFLFLFFILFQTSAMTHYPEIFFDLKTLDSRLFLPEEPRQEEDEEYGENERESEGEEETDEPQTEDFLDSPSLPDDSEDHPEDEDEEE